MRSKMRGAQRGQQLQHPVCPTFGLMLKSPCPTSCTCLLGKSSNAAGPMCGRHCRVTLGRAALPSKTGWSAPSAMQRRTRSAAPGPAACRRPIINPLEAALHARCQATAASRHASGTQRLFNCRACCRPWALTAVVCKVSDLRRQARRRSPVQLITAQRQLVRKVQVGHPLCAVLGRRGRRAARRPWRRWLRSFRAALWEALAGAAIRAAAADAAFPAAVGVLAAVFTAAACCAVGGAVCRADVVEIPQS